MRLLRLAVLCLCLFGWLLWMSSCAEKTTELEYTPLKPGALRADS